MNLARCLLNSFYDHRAPNHWGNINSSNLFDNRRDQRHCFTVESSRAELDKTVSNQDSVRFSVSKKLSFTPQIQGETGLELPGFLR
jgi:hypothetical protein